MLELLETQTRRDALPSLGLRNVDRQSGRILVASVDSPTIQHSRGLQPTSNESKTSNQSTEQTGFDVPAMFLDALEADGRG
jgi:hypothetical protein